MITRKEVFKPPSTSGPQPNLLASSCSTLRSERRTWPFTDRGAAVVAAAGEQTRVDTERDVNSGNSIGSSSRPLPWEHLPFRLRPGSGDRNVVGHVSNTTMIKRPLDPVVIYEVPADDAQQLEVYLVFTLKIKYYAY
jgi:hypothetical protein